MTSTETDATTSSDAASQSDGGEQTDAAAGRDTGGQTDATGGNEAGDRNDASDSGGQSDDGSGSDAGQTEGGSAEVIERHVHIYISNTCVVSVDPTEVTVPREQSVLFTYHNHSVDYEADVWMSYGGGYLGLPPGGLWADPIERCTELFSYTAHADVSIRGLGVDDPYCPGQRMTIHCE